MTVATGTPAGSAACRRVRSSAADCGGVSRPSVNACTTVLTPALCRYPARAAAWSWCEWTPPGETSPIRWQVPPVFFSASTSAVKAGRLGDAAVRHGVADPHQFLLHHAAGADIQVPDLGVAHLALRQPDVAAGGVQEARAGTTPTGRRRSGSSPAGRRCPRFPRASRSRRGSPASPVGSPCVSIPLPAQP